ncbi:hypothetical protein Tco_1109894 [Tanacetum coccineum]|uniref:MAK10-like protein n=1 Tax=Tanacetum coccineum TaxID=301880 RepID=A0ABQ5IIF6_9ASTR
MDAMVPGRRCPDYAKDLRLQGTPLLILGILGQKISELEDWLVNSFMVLKRRESTVNLFRSMDSFQGLTSKVPHHGIDLWLYVQIFYDHVNPATRRTIDQSAGHKLHDKNAKESWALIKDLSLYNNKSWNDPRDFAKPIKAIYLPQDVPNASDRRLIELENQVQCLMEAHLGPKPPVQVNKIASSCKICSGPYNTNYCMENPEQAFVDYASSRRGFLATASAVIDCKKAKIAVEEGITRSIFGVKEIDLDGVGARPPYYAKKDFMNYHLLGEWEIARDAKLNPFKDVLVFRKMVEFLGAIPINVKGNIWESEELIEKKIDWNKPPKEGKGAWHIKIKLIDPDGEKFNRTFQSIPTTRKLSEKENPSEIIDLEHFYDSYQCDSESS